MNLHWIDTVIVIAYIVATFAIAVWVEKLAGKSLNAYFLGEGKIHWTLLGCSGSSTYFDVTGTMWMVSVFYMFGMRGLWQHWMYSFAFAGFMMAYKAKWAYRAPVLTGIEWLAFRYGSGRAGKAARLTTVVVSLTSMVLLLGYTGTGMGKFMEEFLPAVPKTWSVPGLYVITGIYIIVGGFFSVVYTDFFQTILLSAAAIYIAVLGFIQVDPAAFRQTVGDDWFSLTPVWKLSRPPAEYPDLFGLLVMLWVTKGVLGLLSAGGGSIDFQRFRAARSEADACKIGFSWGLVISVRWGLVMGFTAFGLSILAGQGTPVDSERVLPMMLNKVLPVGVKGLILAGLLAAFMSTFDSLLNVAASFVVNDLVKPVWKAATSRQLVWVSYAATVGLLVISVFISNRTEHIRQIWNPINFALGAALLAPGVLTSYWWRMGGWAHCVSGLCTLPAAYYINRFTDLRELQYFPILAGISFLSCIAGGYLFPPAPDEALKNFYRKVRPFGFWGPVRKMLAAEGEDPSRFKRDRFDIPIAIVGTVFFVLLYILIMDVVVHNWTRVIWMTATTGALGVVLYFIWWRPLNDSGSRLTSTAAGT